MFMGLGHVGRQMLAAKAAPALNLDFTGGVLDSRITFVRASGASYYNSSGVLTQAASGAPRFDYDPVSHLPRGLLIEEQRTNVVTNSGQLTDFTLSGGTTTLAALQAPDGTTTGVRLTEDTSNAEHYREFSFTPTANGVYTGSMHVHASARTNVALGLRVAGNWVGGNAIAIADLVAGTIAVVSGTATATIQPVSGGWYRIAITAPAVAAPSGNSTIRIGLATGNTLANATYTGNGTSDGYFWGAQLEVGGFITSYIPTTAAAVQRNGDQATMPLGAWFNQTNGTLLFEYMLPIAVAPAAGVSQYVGDVSVGSTTNRYAMRAQAGGNQTAVYIVAQAGTPVVSGTLFTNTALLKQKVAVAYSPTGQLGSGIGNAPVALAAPVPTGPLTTLCIGATGTGNPNQLDGYITNVRYWNYTMTAAQLQNATT